jgi:uncharacterized repeat protein (TIGR03806 family)
MKVIRFVFTIFALLALVHCAVDTPNELEQESTGSSSSALCAAEWSPTWKQGSGANEWWVEYEIGGGTVASAYLEIPGVRNVQLAAHYGKWAASAGARIATGTQVILHATTTAGANAQTTSFGYLTQTTPSSDPCTGGGGGTDAGACFAPTFTQGSANEWWVEYFISGDIASAYFQVIGGQRITLTAGYGKWRGKPSAAIARGTPVLVHAESSTGQIAETETFGYLVDTSPRAKACGSGGGGTDAGVDSGVDSGGGGAGTCTFRSTWQQASANEWWVEYTLSGSVRAASLRVVGGQTVTMSTAWNKWSGKPSARIPTGTSVVLRVESTAGEIAETSPFRYLVDTTGTTSTCTTPGPTNSGLDARPSNTTCIAPAQPPAATTSMIFTRVFPNVTTPEIMAIAQPPGDGSRWFILNREGGIYSFASTTTSATATKIADFPTIARKTVTTDLSGGMLGFAFHPQFASNGRLFVTFTTIGSSGSGYASEVGYLTSNDGGRTFSSYTRVFGFNRAALEWNGGAIAFGPDGYLYLGFGASDSDGAQSKTSYFGKILRIDVDHTSTGRAYAIPATNPFAAGGGHPEIYAWGFRQPWRFSFDRATGDLWSPDIGQSSWEEIDRVEVGKNYGWPCREGAHSYWAASDPNKCPSTANLVDPVYEYAANGGASAIGGYVYRGVAAPGFNGTYVFGDQVRQVAYAFRYDASTRQTTTVAVNSGGATIPYTSIAEDDAGEIYATTVFQSGIWKLVPSGTGSSTFPDRLSKSGCFEATDPKRPTSGVIPYRVNAALWSDGLDKERGLALPNGTTIGVRADGDFDFPIGSVLSKTFSLAGKRIETRLFMRHGDGSWAGYSYEWNDAQTDALLLPGAKTKSIGDRNWTFPSRTDCMRCHTAAAGFTLGLELGQQNGDFTYPSTGRTANQLETLEHIGMFASALPASPPAYPTYDGTAPLEARARSYLHANCSGCHRPNGGTGRAAFDVRFATTFKDTNTCGATPNADDIGVPNAKILDPGSPETSVISIRVHRLDGFRMPPLGTQRVDTDGVNLLDSWIRGVTACP